MLTKDYIKDNFFFLQISFIGTTKIPKPNTKLYDSGKHSISQRMDYSYTVEGSPKYFGYNYGLTAYLGGTGLHKDWKLLLRCERKNNIVAKHDTDFIARMVISNPVPFFYGL